jgi:FkbM family methyltransferase
MDSSTSAATTSTPHGPLAAELLRGLIENSHAYQYNNTDYARLNLSPARRLYWRARDAAFALAAKAGFTRKGLDADPRGRIRYLLEHLPAFEESYALLADDESRALFVDLLKFRILGARHVRLRRNNDAFWDHYNNADRRYAVERGSRRAWRWKLNRYRLPSSGGAIELHAHLLNILDTFLLEQYACRRAPWPNIDVREGDVVVDGGACWGDTALYFADRVGAGGKVYAFEFMPDNIALFRENIALNPALAPRIELVEHAVWHESGHAITYNANGPGTTLTGAEGDGASERTASTLTIDDLVRQRGLTRLDFIKLDIEGAELHALRGAEETIRRFQPRLAVSLYHRNEDFVEIPRYLAGLGVGYRFHLDHFTIHDEETVLFAAVG